MAQRDAVFPASRHDLYTSQTYPRQSDREICCSCADFETQVRLAFANLEATLKAGGCGLDDIVDVTTFHADPENQSGALMAVKADVFPQAPYPNWTAIGINWLTGVDFEIKVIARIPG